MKGLRQIVKEEQCEPPVGLAALIGEPFSLKQLHGDSFIPSWLVHGTGNALAYTLALLL